MVTLANGNRLRVAESGERGHPTILLVHGLGASIYQWRDWFAPLATAGFRALAVDLTGHGLSDRPEDPRCYRLDAMSAAVRELISIEELQSVDVVAQSMGGTIMLEVASTPGSHVRRLALVNPACFGKVRHWRFLRFASRPAIDVILPKLVARWMVARAHRLVFGDPAGITERDEDEYWAPSQFPAYTRAMRRLVREFPWKRAEAREMAVRLKALRAPVLAILGTRDRLVLGAMPYVAELQREGAPLALAVIDGGGHAVNEERPREVVRRVLEFIDHTAVK